MVTVATPRFIPFDAIVIAVDYSASVQTVSERFGHLPNVIVVRADAKSLPFRSESVDAIPSYSCFNHLDNPKEGIGGGFLVFLKLAV